MPVNGYRVKKKEAACVGGGSEVLLIELDIRKEVPSDGREAQILCDVKGTGACRCSTNNEKLVIVVWPAY